MSSKCKKLHKNSTLLHGSAYCTAFGVSYASAHVTTMRYSAGGVNPTQGLSLKGQKRQRGGGYCAAFLCFALFCLLSKLNVFLADEAVIIAAPCKAPAAVYHVYHCGVALVKPAYYGVCRVRPGTEVHIGLYCGGYKGYCRIALIYAYRPLGQHVDVCLYAEARAPILKHIVPVSHFRQYVQLCSRGKRAEYARAGR